MRMQKVREPTDLSLRELLEVQNNLRMAFLDKSPVIVFNGGVPKIEFEGEVI